MAQHDSTAIPAGASAPFRPYLSLSEVNELLGISRATGYRLINGGEIPHVRVGKQIRIPRDALEERLRASEAAGGEN